MKIEYDPEPYVVETVIDCYDKPIEFVACRRKDGAVLRELWKLVDEKFDTPISPRLCRYEYLVRPVDEAVLADYLAGRISCRDIFAAAPSVSRVDLTWRDGRLAVQESPVFAGSAIPEDELAEPGIFPTPETPTGPVVPR